MLNNKRLKIAIQKSGRLSESTLDLLKRCGLKINKPKDRLIAHVKNMPIDILLVRDDDIPGLVMDGVVDLGFAGENVVQEVQLQRISQQETADFTKLKKLDYGYCQLSVAFPEEKTYTQVQDLEGVRIATSYPYLLSSFLENNGVSAKIVHLTGSVEVAPRAGLADAICDLVSSGVTLEANGLREVEIILESSAAIIQRAGIPGGPIKDLIEQLTQRIDGVLPVSKTHLTLPTIYSV